MLACCLLSTPITFCLTPALLVRPQRNRSRDDRWGFHLVVREMDGLSWLSEHTALSKPSLEWACWLFDLLINVGGFSSDDADLPPAVPVLSRMLSSQSSTTQTAEEMPPAHSIGAAAVYRPEVFRAMLTFLMAKGTPYKNRVVSSLTQLLRQTEHAHALARQLPAEDLRKLAGFQDIVYRHCDVLVKDAFEAIASQRNTSVVRSVICITTWSTACRCALAWLCPSPVSHPHA